MIFSRLFFVLYIKIDSFSFFFSQNDDMREERKEQKETTIFF